VRTSHILLRLLAVINIMLVGVIGAVGVAAAAAQSLAPTKPTAAVAAGQTFTDTTNQAACAASIRKQLPASVSASDVAAAAKNICAPLIVTETTTADIRTNALLHPSIVPNTGGGYCPCTNLDFTDHWQVKSAVDAWSATLQAEWSGDNMANFITRSWSEDYQRCVEDYAYGYNISMGACTSGGPDPANHGQTMTMHMDFLVSALVKGFPVSDGHGVNVNLLVNGQGGWNDSAW